MSREREMDKSKHLQNILQDLREGVVIVEGKHDKETLAKLGIESFTYYEVFTAPEIIGKSVEKTSKTVYLLFDNDKGGEDKRKKMEGYILSFYPKIEINASLSKHFLISLNCTSVEQVYKPLTKLIRGDIDGENIFGYSKIHGSSQLQH